MFCLSYLQLDLQLAFIALSVKKLDVIEILDFDELRLLMSPTRSLHVKFSS